MYITSDFGAYKLVFCRFFVKETLICFRLLIIKNFLEMNKKILLLVTFLVFGLITIQAQQSRYGFRLGVNYSDIDFNDGGSGLINADDDARIGFAAGFFATYYLSEKFSIQPELQFSAQGEKTQVVNRDSSSLDRLNYNALQLPILLNYHITENLSISVGPQVGLRIWEWERSDDYETFLFSAVGGIGYYVTDNIGIDLRASYGFTDVIKTSNECTFNANGVNHYLQLTVSYRL